MTGVVVDVGKSATRCWSDGVVATAAGLAPDRAGRAGAGRMLAAAIGEAWEQHPAASTVEAVDVVAIGSTFLPLADELEAAGAELRKLWPTAEISLAEDGILAHGYALGRAGVVASVGTGTIVIGIDEAGRVVRVDGWGPDLGDRGSAWQIGNSGMRAAYRHRDGVTEAAVLAAELTTYLDGPLDLATATRLLGEDDRVRRIAGFAVPVLAAAADGDATATTIVARAAAELVDSIAAAAEQSGSRSVALVGGLTADRHWTAVVEGLCAGRRLAVHPAGSLRQFDPGVLLRAPYRAGCAWSSVPR
ncbi:MAG TPA: BadF/BadG/BcrA/BcrD ATPase family protein [Microlunatus sp.]